jgi:xanthine dehydrogenase YagS FAD-binding subunit
MKAFDHLRPATLEQALELLPSGRDPGARERTRLVAGGQDLYTELKDRLIAPDELVDLKGVGGLDVVEVAADRSLTIGALATIGTLERHLRVGLLHPLLKEAAAAVASPQIRNVGTVGGNLCQRPRCWYYRHSAIPCIKKGGPECLAYGGLSKYNAILGGGPSYIVHPSDLAPALVALGAVAEIAGRRGTRTVELERFFTLPSEGSILRENVLAGDEILTRLQVPAPSGEGWRSTYLKFRERGSYDFALAAVALALRMQGDTIAEARRVLGGVAPIPWRCNSAEELLVGRKIDAATCAAAGEEALRGAQPLEHNRYKVPLAKGLITRALQKLASA